MKHEWVVYAVLAVLSVGAGLAIAGLPSSPPVDPTIVVPDSTLPPVETDAGETTVVTEVAVTEPTSTTIAESTTSVAETTTTEALPETTTTTSTTTVPPLPERSTVDVVVANGANIGGIASATASRLEELGYVDVRPTDGTEIVFFTIVYYVDDALPLAERLAADLDLPATSIAPLAEAPDIIGDLQGESLLVYLGSDQG